MGRGGRREREGGRVRGHRLISYPLSQKVKLGGESSFFPFIIIIIIIIIIIFLMKV
jgi:hypothetical protein